MTRETVVIMCSVLCGWIPPSLCVSCSWSVPLSASQPRYQRPRASDESLCFPFSNGFCSSSVCFYCCTIYCSISCTICWTILSTIVSTMFFHMLYRMLSHSFFHMFSSFFTFCTIFCTPLYHIWLVVWNMFYFPIQLGMSSSQLTFIFFRGFETTNQL